MQFFKSKIQGLNNLKSLSSYGSGNHLQRVMTERMDKRTLWRTSLLSTRSARFLDVTASLKNLRPIHAIVA